MTVSILLSNFNIQYLLLPLTCLFTHSTMFVFRLQYPLLFLFIYYIPVIFFYLYLYKVLSLVSLLCPDEDTCMSVSMKHRQFSKMEGYLSLSRTSD